MTEFDAEYDVVVIGSGASGLSAALQAVNNGQSVAVLEKEARTGGSSSFAEGHAAFESDEQEKRGIRVTKEEGYWAYLSYSHWRCDPALVSRYVDNAATTIRKLRTELGVEYEDVTITAPDQPGELVTWHLPKGEVAHVIELMEARCAETGVELFLETPAQRILEDNGRVSGVVATDSDGEEVVLGAKAVVVGTGGYANNPEMLDRYAKQPIGGRAINVGGPGNTGDGITMLKDAGNVENDNIGTLLLFPLMRGKTITSHVNNAGMQPYLWVDASGRRFTNEEAGLNFGNAGDIVAALPGSFYWAVLDQGHIDKLVSEGNEVGLGVYVHNYEKLVNLPAEIEADAADRSRTNVVGADTVEDLARGIGVRPEALAGEVETYNEAARTGVDGRFRKRARYLRPLDRAPFYAIKMEPGIMITMGAMRIDDRMRALDENGEVIDGLYVVGCDAGGLFGESYQLTVPGSANGFAFTSGWLAADDIASRIAAGEL
ncbi:FAD-dependent oxidoreductase [uncultured Propionibacterium sp.]|uniref:FAD-dependent oxidoreductase n=1 Tax=uncultured Propionibacterium sp. TaxID=218066 RepID=UPI00292ECF80|nr:FAD-dependent oxidoreductase [uncultured Propionibacterium sp.]